MYYLFKWYKQIRSETQKNRAHMSPIIESCTQNARLTVLVLN